MARSDRQAALAEAAGRLNVAADVAEEVVFLEAGPDESEDLVADAVIVPPWRTVLGPDEPIRITRPGVYDLTAAEYHDVKVTGEWFSNSDAKKLLATCPAQFDYDRRHGVRKISDAFDLGHVWHAVILGKGEAYQVFEPKKLDGRTKVGKEQKLAVDEARAAGITPIYGDQFALIEAMAEAVKADRVAFDLMNQPGRQEVCLFWRQKIKVTNPNNKLYGQIVTVQRRAMIDHLPDMPAEGETVTLVDGKTADEVKPDDGLRKKIYDYAYHRQADTYAAGVEALFNRDAEVVFIMQSKKPPYLIVPVDLDTPAMLIAAAENREALELWAECVATGEWPGYVKGRATSGVPAWIERMHEDEMVIS
ncbi:MAG TPA: PD-(D/E)XK nuclease-like domain-containing protein [Kineosporiaceae bacterium]|nr:PD-(D/E)XK nuclease-like domain-containing protein [Kineosporiaceae bacterium]